MKLLKLLAAEMYRDGGSLEATFLDTLGTESSLFLQVSRMPDDEGYHHRDLYPSRYRREGAMPKPILKGSEQEREWMDALASWIGSNISEKKLASLRSADFQSSRTPVSDWTREDWRLYWLVLLFDHIPRRE